MLLNVITRTSDRPNYFKECYKSVQSQKSPIEHWVTVDNQNSWEYVYLSDVEHVVKVEPTGTGNCPWNAYLNEAIKNINGWVMVLDDDDLFTTPQAAEKILKKLRKKEDVVFWRVGFPGTLIPDDKHWQQQPTKGQISMIGMAFHSDWVKEFPFNHQCLGDHRLAQRFWQSGNIQYINETLTKINRSKTGGHGRKDDLKT